MCIYICSRSSFIVAGLYCSSFSAPTLLVCTVFDSSAVSVARGSIASGKSSKSSIISRKDGFAFCDFSSYACPDLALAEALGDCKVLEGCTVCLGSSTSPSTKETLFLLGFLFTLLRAIDVYRESSIVLDKRETLVIVGARSISSA